MPKVFFPQYRKGRGGIPATGGSLLEHARKLGVPIASECGGLGRCGRCVVRIEKGLECLGEKTKGEKEHSLGPQERLACQATVSKPECDIYVLIKEFGKYSILSESVETPLELDPFVRRKDERVIHTSGQDLGAYRGQILGLAIDVGTTTLAMQVMDLERGCEIKTLVRQNPQIAYGNDVISRIGHTINHKRGLKELQNKVIRGINESLKELDAENHEISKYIYDAVVVGNSTMRSIFFGQDVTTLGMLPFEPLSLAPITRKAEELALAINPKSNVYGACLIGGQAGADALANILASGMYKSDSVVMVIDIGTNGEVIIGNKERIMSASCAAGGAFEGATIKCGVGAIEGAIKKIWLSNERVGYETIGDKPPIGICGSGLIDLLAELLRKRIMTPKAKIKEEFFITDLPRRQAGKISLTQQDIFQLITAKAGLRLDQDSLIEYYGTDLEEIEKIYLAGAFGNFINPKNAIAIGLLPPAPDKVVPIGNGALAGARAMLLSKEMRGISEEVARKIEHIKPNEREPDFAYKLAERMYF